MLLRWTGLFGFALAFFALVFLYLHGFFLLFDEAKPSLITTSTTPSFHFYSHTKHAKEWVDYDAIYFSMIRRYIQASNCTTRFAIDAGCNHGTYSLFLAALGLQVVCLEVHKPYAQLASLSVGLNPNLNGSVKVINAGLSHKRSVQYVNYQEGSTYLSGRAGPLNEGVDVYPVSELLSGDVCFMKVDVEGLEMNVFQGCGWACLLYRIGAVLVEVAPARWTRGGVGLQHAVRITDSLTSVNRFGMFLICRHDPHCPCKHMNAMPSLTEVKNAGLQGTIYQLRGSKEAVEQLYEFMKANEYDCNMWFEDADAFLARVASLHA